MLICSKMLGWTQTPRLQTVTCSSCSDWFIYKTRQKRVFASTDPETIKEYWTAIIRNPVELKCYNFFIIPDAAEHKWAKQQFELNIANVSRHYSIAPRWNRLSIVSSLLNQKIIDLKITPESAAATQGTATVMYLIRSVDVMVLWIHTLCSMCMLSCLKKWLRENMCLGCLPEYAGTHACMWMHLCKWVAALHV